ncbi:sigma-70 family RNA polymerase sigma factor [Pelagibacterium montanilacus]|uniref:sigma-70 family RNA polymerase sigma factor n=1 Tax=Pelagibacterium montanilacus TaxID=2185280 RepID=UPI000F8D91EF|nr:sigma-70 family RNA polymerase sigma factor [Pelagibacterium montanilacus]
MSDTTSKPVPEAKSIADPADLLARIAESKDRKALAELFRQLAPRLKSMMLKLGADGALAEDLVQETLLAVWRKAHLYSPDRGAAVTWIFTIARNLRIDQLRRLSNKPYEDLEGIETTDDTPNGLQRIEQQEIISRVKTALGDLPKDQQEVIRLSFLSDMTHSDIAERLDIPLGTVKSRLRLAYGRLRPLLEDLQ